MTGRDLLHPVRLYWSTRSSREQVMLSTLAAIVILVLLWFIVLQPSLSFRHDARRDFLRAYETHIQTVSDIERYRSVQDALPENTGAQINLRALIGNRAQQNGLAITRLQPLEDGQLSVWIEQASETSVMSFLIALTTDDQVIIRQLAMDRQPSGLVRTRLLLSQGMS